MHFICNKQDLLYAINLVQKACTQKSTLPILGGILLECKDNKVRLAATDLEWGIETSFNAKVIEPGTTVVLAKFFSEVVRKLPELEININVDPSFNLKMLCGEAEFNFYGFNPQDFPVLPKETDEKVIKIKTAEFKKMIRKTSFAAATDEGKDILKGIFITKKNGYVEMVSTDSFRLAYFRSESFISEDKVDEGEWKAIIPKNVLNEVGKILPENENDEIKICLSDKNIWFVFEEIKIYSSLIDGKYIEYSRFIQSSDKKDIKANLNTFSQTIDRTSVFSREENNTAIFDFKGNHIEISANTQVGKTKEKIFIDDIDLNLKVTFNVKFLMDVLKVFDTAEFVMGIGSAESACVFREFENENYTYILMPVRS